ncbi:MAG: hypothetical protein K8F54_00850 [Altibacter sp.]|uniref:hypothetical protein n=1 Tax=Altibacter sp. TaxID=2024823 RepID=UPI001DF322BE|nr:hypothetical protein [Altibacter sp.]MBZ0326127.1 hypothetical protein [Altibacter sp.]
MKKLFFIAITTILILTACKSKEGTVSDTSCTTCEDAIIRYYGDPALDGCGWVVDAASTIYMPENLQAEFYEDSLKVSIKYKVKGRVNCGLVKDAHIGIIIEEIYKKE